MKRYLGRYSEVTYAALRIAAGVLLALHGVQKLFGFPEARPGPEVGSQLWIGAVIEIVCGPLIALGLLTSWAAFIASGMMAVAYFQFHWKLQGGAPLFPAVNKGELAAVYAFLFLYIASVGGGRYSVDARRRT
jgi:putative oxidoreductase